VQFQTENGHFAFISSPFGGLGTTYDVHLRLTDKHTVDLLSVITKLFSLSVTAEALQANTDRKLAFSLEWGQFDPKFQVQWVVPHQPFFMSEN